MPISPRWRLANSFTLRNAAYCWVDEEPDPYSTFIPSHPETRTVLSVLEAAARTGELVVDDKENPMSVIGNRGASVVSRAELVRFAEAKGERPKFLFDDQRADGAPPKSRAGTPSDASGFEIWASDFRERTGRNPSADEVFDQFARDRGLSREWSRKVHKTLPREYNRTRGKPSRAPR
jgi:hypothetical protein